MKNRFLIFILLVSTSIFGQNKLFDLVIEFSLPGKPQAWAIDNVGNLTYIYKGIITKTDSTGNLLFTQSYKKMGSKPQIFPINSMKTILFSEDQQTICMLDNTLSINGKCKELETFGITFATSIAISARPNLIWVYDQSNSTLKLIDIINDKVEQQVKNFNGLMNSKVSIIGMLENDNKLYVWNSDKTVFEFDMLLNLSNEYNVSAIPLFFVGDFMTSLNKDRLELLRPFDEQKRAIASPSPEATNFFCSGKNFYFEKDNKIEKFRFKGFQY